LSDLTNHPYYFLKHLIKRHHEIDSLFFRVYSYNSDKPVAIPPNRDWSMVEIEEYSYSAQDPAKDHSTIEIPVEDYDEETVQKLLGFLKPNQNLILLSQVSTKSGKIKHIPFIDLIIPAPSFDLAALKEGFNKEGAGSGTLFFYNSGHSLHAYGDWLVDDLKTYLGRLLLVDVDGKQHQIDRRWIGRQLIKDVMGLRWSCNSPRYLKMPKYIGCNVIGSNEHRILPGPLGLEPVKAENIQCLSPPGSGK
jgi:hypothetical protein